MNRCAILVLSFCMALTASKIYSDFAFIAITIPKSGTHLLAKILTQLTGKRYTPTWPLSRGFPGKESWEMCDEKLDVLTNPLTGYYWMTHLMYQDKQAEMILSKQCRIFFLYRDPRDQMISAYFYVKKNKKIWAPDIFPENMEDFIFQMIEQKEISDPFISTHGIADFYARYLPWKEISEVCCLRFEDLVGPLGGGTQEKQEEAIRYIAAHLGVDVPSDLGRFSQTLFGSSITFRSGQIGSWKHYFNEGHKEAFKQKAGQLLIDLGYELDLNW